MCPPVLIGALYALWADTQVRPYTNHINTTRSAIRRSNTCICMDAWTHDRAFVVSKVTASGL